MAKAQVLNANACSLADKFAKFGTPRQLASKNVAASLAAMMSLRGFVDLSAKMVPHRNGAIMSIGVVSSSLMCILVIDAAIGVCTVWLLVGVVLCC